jgi:hypothetical protein
VLAIMATLTIFGPQIAMLTMRVVRAAPQAMRALVARLVALRPQRASAEPLAVGELVEDLDHLDELVGATSAPTNPAAQETAVAADDWSPAALDEWRRTHLEASLDADAWLAAELAGLGTKVHGDLQLADTLRRTWAELEKNELAVTGEDSPRW